MISFYLFMLLCTYTDKESRTHVLQSYHSQYTAFKENIENQVKTEKLQVFVHLHLVLPEPSNLSQTEHCQPGISSGKLKLNWLDAPNNSKSKARTQQLEQVIINVDLSNIEECFLFSSKVVKSVCLCVI